MTDLRAELEQSLDNRFHILRELGGGGMSRVFLAREIALDRDVVIKVLPPDLAGVNLARFRRETQTAARLHHPHIVPLHAAGEAGGVLYYTMPHVEGETLRGRMATGPMPVDEIIRVLRDVADALAYAHQRQLVHRDIKPENVLLSSGHALVTDFGVAKALSSSDDREVTISTVATAGGLAVGTPAYMAPEQAAGDPRIDHRADLYALGLLGYEMLAGHSPFPSATTPQAMIVAHLAERPRDVGDLRADIPHLLAELVMRCLEKDPEHRPQSAAVAREQLDAMRTPSDGGIRVLARPRRTRRVALTAAALVPIAASAAFIADRDAIVLDREVVAVAPFHVADASLGYLREGMMDLFAAKLTGQGGPRAAEPRAVLTRWRRAGGSDTAALTREAALGVAEGIGAGQLLLGDVTGTADSLVVTARLIDVRDGRLRADARVSGPADSLAKLIDGVTARLLTLRAGEGARMANLTSTSLPALRAYLAGQWLFRQGRYKAAGVELSRALALDSSFALAALALMQTSVWYGDYPAQQRAGAIAWRHQDKLSPRDRAFLLAQLGPRFPKMSPFAEIVRAAAHYRDVAPDRADAWFQYGDLLAHYGPFLGIPSAHAQAEAALREAVAIDSAYSPALEHLVILAARRGDVVSAERYADMYLAADSAGESAIGIRWRIAAAKGDWRLADSIADIRGPLPPTSKSIIGWIAIEDGLRVPQSWELLKRVAASELEEGYAHANIMMHDVSLVLGRPDEAREHLRQMESAVGPLPREVIKDALIAGASIGDADSAAARLMTEWKAPRPARPGQALGGWTGTSCLLPLWKLVAHGDTSLARAGVQRLRDVARDSVSISALAETCGLLVDAAWAARTGAPDAAIRVARADSAMRTGPANPANQFGNVVLAQLWESIGNDRAALDATRRRLYFLDRKTAYGTLLREEGRLAVAVGDTLGAIAAYRHFLALRGMAEPAAAREAESVRRELSALERATAGR